MTSRPTSSFQVPSFQLTSLQASAFLERLLRFLIPYFTDVTADLAAARAEALETLASYGARTRAELLCAVQIIVFGFAALETLGEAKTAEMSPSLRLRFRGCANNLNRSGQKTEQTLLKRLACDAPAATEQEPINDLPEHHAAELLRQTQAAIDAHRTRLSGNRPAHSPQPRDPVRADKRRWGQVMMDTLAAEMGIPIQPASGTSPPPER